VAYGDNIFLKKILTATRRGFNPSICILGGGQGLSIAKMQSYSSSSSNNGVALFDYDF